MLLNLLQLNKTELSESIFCRFILVVVRRRSILNTGLHLPKYYCDGLKDCRVNDELRKCNLRII